MTLQSSGAISLANIQTEFGGSNPIGIDEYYNAAYGVPGYGQISLDDFYGKSVYVPPPPPSGFGGWVGSQNNNGTLGTSFVIDPVNTSNSFTGNTVTPGILTRYTIYMVPGQVSQSATLRFYLNGVLNTTWTGSLSGVQLIPNANSSVRFDSTLTDTDPYYSGGGGHYSPDIWVYAIYNSQASPGLEYDVDAYRHSFDYANVGDPDYDD